MPSPFQIIIHFGFVPSQTSLTLTKFIEKPPTYIHYQISFIKFSMEYILVLHLFELVDVIIIFKLGSKLEKFDLAQSQSEL
jgi:hypothetical protein